MLPCGHWLLTARILNVQAYSGSPNSPSYSRPRPDDSRGGEKYRRPRDNVRQRVNKAKGGGSGQDKELSETERAELERLRKENATLRMERDFAKKVAAWFAKQQP